MIDNYITNINKGYIESVFNEIEKYFLSNKKIFFETIKMKIKNYNIDYLKRYVLNTIYNYFIDNLNFIKNPIRLIII